MAVSFALSLAPAIDATSDSMEKLLRECMEGSMQRARVTAAEVHDEIVKQAGK